MYTEVKKFHWNSRMVRGPWAVGSWITRFNFPSLIFADKHSLKGLKPEMLTTWGSASSVLWVSEDGGFDEPLRSLGLSDSFGAVEGSWTLFAIGDNCISRFWRASGLSFLRFGSVLASVAIWCRFCGRFGDAVVTVEHRGSDPEFSVNIGCDSMDVSSSASNLELSTIFSLYNSVVNFTSGFLRKS